MDWFRNFPMVMSPRLHRGDALLTLLIIFSGFGILLMLLAAAVSAALPVLPYWLIAWVVLLLSYSTKKMRFSMGSFSVSTDEGADEAMPAASAVPSGMDEDTPPE